VTGTAGLMLGNCSRFRGYEAEPRVTVPQFPLRLHPACETEEHDENPEELAHWILLVMRDVRRRCFRAEHMTSVPRSMPAARSSIDNQSDAGYVAEQNPDAPR